MVTHHPLKPWSMSWIGYLDHPFKNRHIEKRLIKEKRGANVEMGREGLFDEGCCTGALSNLFARFSRVK